MRIFLSIISFLIILDSGYCQSKQIPMSKVISVQEKTLHCLNDSSNTVSAYCSLGLDGFKVMIYAAYLDKDKREIRLVGRVCMSEKANGPGVPEVNIFKAIKTGNKISDRSLVGETTDVNKDINHGGFFDITVTIGKGEFLFFYGTGFFLREFALFKLLP